MHDQRPGEADVTEVLAPRLVVVREGKNLNRRVLGVVLSTVGKRALGRQLEKTAKAVEARNNGASTDGRADGEPVGIRRTACGDP